jgi:hypothetical protein
MMKFVGMTLLYFLTISTGVMTGSALVSGIEHACDGSAVCLHTSFGLSIVVGCAFLTYMH